MNYKVVISEGEDGWYVVECPSIPGCVSQGKTVEEALENIKDAIQGCFEVLNERIVLKGSLNKLASLTVDDFLAQL
jgi:predicted RNase H-like HicB family nuclease